MSTRNQIIVAYTYATDPAWGAVFSHAESIHSVIVNPGSGVGGELDSNYAALIVRLKAAGIRVLGYCATAYGARALSVVRREVIQWWQWYQPNGIFFDEGATAPDKFDYYKAAIGHARTQIPGGLVVCNFGTVPDRSLVNLPDISCIAETDQETYVNKPPMPAWVFQLPSSRLYNIVFQVTDAAMVRNRITQNNAGFWTMVKTPGPDPQFNLHDIIWPDPPPETPMPPTQPQSTSETNQANLLLQQTARILQAPPEMTMTGLPALAEKRMLELIAARATAGPRLTAIPDDQLIAELARRLKLAGQS